MELEFSMLQNILLAEMRSRIIVSSGDAMHLLGLVSKLDDSFVAGAVRVMLDHKSDTNE